MPTANDFGSVETGKMSAAFNFTLTNMGGGTSGQPMITVSNGEFTASGCTAALNPATSCMIAVVFKPSSTGSKTATLTVSAPNGGMQTANLSGTGVVAGLNIMGAPHDFGAVAVGGMSDPFTLTVVNTGGVALSALNVSLNGDFAFTAMGNKCAAVMALAPNANCTVEVIFTPKSSGGKQGSLIASAGGQTVTGVLSGTGQIPASFLLSPTNPMFAAVVGQMSQPTTINIANVGDAATGAVTVAVSGTNAAEFKMTTTCLAPLAGKSMCTASVIFAPTSPGPKMATLTVSSPIGGMAMTALTGTADAASSLSVEPATADFGAVAMGKTSAARDFTVTNKGGTATAALTVTTSTGEFTVTANTCGGMALAPNATCTVSVIFAPATLGGKQAILTIMGAAAEVGRATLSGTGVGIGLTASPTALMYQTIATGQTSPAQTVTITNTGGTATGTLVASLSGTSASQFAIGGNSCNASLPPAGTCTVSITFSPTTPGDKVASLVVNGNTGETVSVALAGAGITPNMLAVVGAGLFADTVIGQTSAAVTFTVTDPPGGMATGKLSFNFTGASAAEYAIATNGCTAEAGLQPGTSCTLTVTFSPTGAGTRTASLLVSGAASGASTGVAPLAGVGLNKINTVPASRTFAQQSVGTTSPAQAFEVEVRDAFTAVTPTVTGEFSVVPGSFQCGNPLAPVGSTTFTGVNPADPSTWFDGHNLAHTCTISVVFSPIGSPTPAARAGTLVLTGTGGVTFTANLSGTATGPLSASPSPLDFATVVVGVAKPLTVTARNAGSAAITGITNTISGTNANEFVITNDLCVSAAGHNGTLAAGGDTCGITISLQATSAGTKTALLTIAGVIGTTPISTTVDLTGVAGMTTGISLSPNPASVGPVPITGTGKVTVTITNPMAGVATGAITIGPSSNVLFTKVDDNCVGAMNMLPPGGTCTFAVQFAPTNAAGTSAQSATIVVTTANSGSATLTVTGAGTQPLSISPAGADFGNSVSLDATPPSRAFTVSNLGAAIPATLPGPGVNVAIVAGGSSFQPGWFTLGTETCSAGIPGATGATPGTCVISVQFLPLGAANANLGAATADLQVDFGTIIATAPLTGTKVLDAAIAWDFIAADQTRDFGKARVNTTTGTEVFTLRNTGGMPTGGLTFSVAAPFTIVGGGATTCVTSAAGPPVVTGTVLNPNETCNIAVAFAPTAAGAATADIVVTAPKESAGDLNAAGGGAPNAAKISLAGTGVVANAVGSQVLSPNPVGLADTAMNAMSAAVTVTYQNFDLTNDAIISTLASSNPAFVVAATAAPGGCTPGKVVAHAASANSPGTCTITVTFAPTANPGTIEVGTITVNSNQPAATGGVFGRVKRNGFLQVSSSPPGGGAFGQVDLNTSSADRTWVITNAGEAATGVLTVTSSDSHFVTGGNCAAAIPAGGMCNLTVHFSPGSSTAALSSNISLSGTNVDNSPFAVVTATGKGVTAAALTIQGGATTRDFGLTNRLGNPSAIQTVIIENLDANARTSGPLQVTLSNSTDFIVTGCDTAKVNGLDATDNCTLNVVFQPKSVAALGGTLTITGAPGGTITVTLAGTSIPSVTVAPATQSFAAGQEVTFNVALAPASNPTATGPLSVTVSGAAAMSLTKTMDTCTGVSMVATGTTTCVVKLQRNNNTATGAATLSVSGTTAGNVGTSALTIP